MKVTNAQIIEDVKAQAARNRARDRIAFPAMLTKMSDSQLNDYIEWLAEIRGEERTASPANDAFETASYYLSDELRRRDW